MGKSRKIDAPAIGMEDQEPVGIPDGFGLDSPGDGTATKPKDNSRPYCPRHNCLMIANRSDKVATHYRCRVDGCDAAEVRMRPEHPAPIEPQLCPECQSSGVESACEVDPRRSAGKINLVMVCPACRWSVEVLRPTAARMAARIQNRALAEAPLAGLARQPF